MPTVFRRAKTREHMRTMVADTHLGEVIIEISSLSEQVDQRFAALRLLMDERDRLYTERAEAHERALAAALAANDRLTNAIFAASEKAIQKSELAQQSYNERSNEFRSALDDAQKQMLTRNEAITANERTSERFDDIRKQIDTLRENTQISIADLRESRKESVGQRHGFTAGWAAAVAVGTVVVGLLGIGAGVLIRPPAPAVLIPGAASTLVPSP